MKDTSYRSCVATKGNCPYVGKNEYGTYICTIDNIVQVKFFGCIPSKILAKNENLTFINEHKV